MGIIASLLFIILIFAVGFVYNNWTLSFLIALMAGGFAAILAYSNVEEIIQNWSARRCDLEVMLTANLYKPASDPRSTGEFASDNFHFCVKSIFAQIISFALGPVMTMINEEINVAESINEMLDRMRVMQAAFLKNFTNLLNPFTKRFETTGSAFLISFHKMLSAMSRAFGITQAMVYLGMSMVIAVENFVQFIINVVIIIMWIILGLMILIWILILPVFVIIVLTCQSIGNSPFGYMADRVCGELCLDPSTRIRRMDGSVKSIQQCSLGDILEDGTVIEGILEVSAETEPMYVLDGIRVSGAHLVWYEEEEEWIPVMEHPESVASFQKSPRLYCLRTSTRTIPLQGLQHMWTFRDWEELPTQLPSSDTIWDFLVSEILNQKAPRQPTPKEIPLLKEACCVMYQTGEIRKISEVRIGDRIYGSEGFTTVTGIYKGSADFSQQEDFTEGLWVRTFPQSDWIHPTLPSEFLQTEPGWHLTTESGCFWIQTSRFSGFVRDFTEVGVHNLPLTYTYTRKLLKKSFSREESCVSVSLSQGLSSCSQPIF
jgi:hypothetical protein